MTAMTPIERLPASARRKWMAVNDSVGDTQALVRAAEQSCRELEGLLRNAGAGSNTADLEHELSRQRGIVAERAAKVASRSQLRAQIQNWMNGVPAHYELVEAPAVKAKRQPNEGPLEAVLRVRTKIDGLKLELRAVQHAAPTREERHEAARVFVVELARRYRPKLKMTRGRLEIELSDPSSFTGRVHPLAASAWADPDALVRRLCAEIDAEPANGLSMSAVDKEKRVKEIRADLLYYERLEEFFISDAELDGVVIERRPLADPLAVLGVALKPVTANEKAVVTGAAAEKPDRVIGRLEVRPKTPMRSQRAR